MSKTHPLKPDGAPACFGAICTDARLMHDRGCDSCKYRLGCGACTDQPVPSPLAAFMASVAVPAPQDKPTNPKDIIGCDKLPLHLWPSTATAMGSLGMLEGLTKYGRSNFRASGIRASIYVDACLRHMAAWFEGEEVAPDSGVPHLANALACIAIIVDARAAGKLHDDRMFHGEGYRKLVDDLTPHVARLKELNADRNPKHYTIADQATSEKDKPRAA